MRLPFPDDTEADALSPELAAGMAMLSDLAMDMRWSWNHAADAVWRELDPVLWEASHSPCDVLQTVSQAKLAHVLADPAFRARINDLAQAKTHAAAAPAWFQHRHPASPLGQVAYFSMEFMLSEALPIYSGGLGNVAGDQLKAASDLGVPVIGIGLLYQQGFFRQVIDREGAQQALYPYNDPGKLPISPLRRPDGEWLRLELAFPGYSLWLRAWQVQVGKTRLYLLDSNDSANCPAHRGITSELYGGGPELRLQQELALGIGGWRLMEALELQPQVCHLNEGHAAFAILERARSCMQANDQSFAEALAVTRAGNLFTTHTAVAAGFDRFPPALIEQYLGGYATQNLGINLHELLALGRRQPDDDGEDFNMAYLAVRGSGAVNAVSRLHGTVSRQLFAPLFPAWPLTEVPVGHVTNGVHMPTWDSAAADELWTETCGKDRWLGTTEELEERMLALSDERLWALRNASSAAFVTYLRGRLARQLTASGGSEAEIAAVQQQFNPAALTLVIARRFATYKRPNLLLHDPARLLRLLTDPARPVQLVIAGKAHPADQAGCALIQAWTRFIRQTAARSNAAFLSDYDMLMAERLVQGADVWINTPRRPWEASGTSGMKVLVNGGLNLSEMDGWWAEAFTPEVGWSLGDGQEHGDDPAWDAAEADALYDRLEREVIPAFYARDDTGIPVAWVQRMRASMAQLTPRFSADRTVRDYTERHYLPAAMAFQSRLADHGGSGRQMVTWQANLDQRWAGLHFGEMQVETDGGRHCFTIGVHLNDIDPQDVRVELYADGALGAAPEQVEMRSIDPPAAGSDGRSYRAYRAAIPDTRHARDYTARIIAHRDGVATPLEGNRIHWQ